VAHTVHAYTPAERHARARDERPDYGLEAAAALGVAADRVFKTLIATVDGRLAAAVVPAAFRLDLKAFASALGGKRAELADPLAAQRASGSVIGGISPLGMRRPMPTVLDDAAMGHETVFVSAGRRGLQLELAPADLVRLADARIAPIARGSGLQPPI
jgi:Cys-tRNA(Pro)/Cys-tRNA(Cys) deacylase